MITLGTLFCPPACVKNIVVVLCQGFAEEMDIGGRREPAVWCGGWEEGRCAPGQLASGRVQWGMVEGVTLEGCLCPHVGQFL